MKLKESNSEGHPDVETKTLHVSPTFFPSVIIWSLHWASALLVLFLLTTSLASGLGIYASDYGNSNGDNGSYVRKSADSSALVVIKKSTKKLTAFERMNLISEDNEHGDKGHDHGGQK